MKRKLAVLVLPVFVLVGCATMPAGTPLQTRLAVYGTETLKGLTDVQEYVNTTASTVPAFKPVGQQITDANQKIHDAAEKMSVALKAYDAAVTLKDKQLQLGNVTAAVELFNGTLGQVFDIQIPQAETAAKILQLYQTVMKTVATLQTEIAKTQVELAKGGA